MNNTNNCTNKNQSSTLYQDLPKNAQLNHDAKAIEWDIDCLGNLTVLNYTNFKIRFLFTQLFFEGRIASGCELFCGGENLIVYSLKECPHIVCFDISKPGVIKRAFINSNKTRNIMTSIFTPPYFVFDMKYDKKNIIARIPEEHDLGIKLGGKILLMHQGQNSTLSIFPKEIVHLIAMQAMAKYEMLLQELEVSSLPEK